MPALAQDAEEALNFSTPLCTPYLQNPSDKGMSILWTTEKPGLSWVEYWPVGDPSKRLVAQDSRLGLRRFKTTKHHVNIKNLKPGETYAYKVYSRPKKKGADVIVPSAGSTEQDGTFTTLDSKKSACKCFIVNDMHARGEEYAGLMKQGGADKHDIIFHNGDIVDWLSDEKVIYDKVLNPLKEFITKVPFVFIRGNHEYRGGMPLNITEYFPPYKTGEYYGLLRQGPVCFLILDTGEDKADDRDELGGITNWVEYFDEQEAWIAEAVEMPEFKTARYKVVLNHIPVTRRESYTGAKIRQQFVPALAKGGVDIMICGHTHRNSFMAGKEEADIPFPILVNDNKGYVTLNADGKQLLIEQFNRDGELVKDVKI